MEYKTHRQRPFSRLVNTTAIAAPPQTQENAGKYDEVIATDNTFRDNMDAEQAAEYVGLSKSYLAKLRMAGDRRRGPTFVKIGRAVIYRRADLDAWLEAHRVATDVEG